MAYGFEQLQQFGYKTETTEGTPIAMLAADYDSTVYSAAIEYAREIIERTPIRSTFSPIQAVGGSLKGKVMATLEPRGSGVDGTAPDWYQLARAAGANLTTDVLTFGEAILAAQEIGTTVTCRGRDGIKERVLSGVRANKLRIFAEGPGQPIKLEFEGEGAYTESDQTTLLAAVAPAVGAPPILLSSALSIGGASVQYKSCEISIENEITSLGDGSTASGYRAFLISKQRIKFAAQVWQTNTSENWFNRTANAAADKLAVSWAFGSGAGLTFTNTGTIYLSESANKAYEDGVAIIPVTGEFITETAAAALTITQS